MGTGTILQTKTGPRGLEQGSVLIYEIILGYKKQITLSEAFSKSPDQTKRNGPEGQGVEGIQKIVLEQGRNPGTGRRDHESPILRPARQLSGEVGGQSPPSLLRGDGNLWGSQDWGS